MTPNHESPDSLAFLVAAPYSGATILSMALQQHPGISSDGELCHPERGRSRKCSCGESLESCPYFRHVFQDMYREGCGYDPQLFYYVPRYSRIPVYSRALEGFWLSDAANSARNALLRLPRYQEKTREFLELHRAATRRSLELRGAQVYFDGTKWLRRIELFLATGEHARVVHLVRDPRGFCASYLRNHSLENDPQNLSTAVAFWKRHWNRAVKLRQRFPAVPWHHVIYEDFAADPDRSLQRIATFLQVEATSPWPAFTRKDMHVTGNRVRFTFDGEIRKDEKWRHLLEPSEAEYVLAETRSEAESAGLRFF